MPSSPVYQETVLAGVPATSDVADVSADDEAFTRIGGSSKKLFDAATAEAATSDPLESVLTEVVSAVLRFEAVAVESVPMANEPAGGGTEFVAVN